MRKTHTARSHTIPGGASKLITLLLPILIAAGAALAYSTSFDGVFMFDEIGRIEKNEQIRGLWPPERFLPGRRPVVTFTLALNYAISGLNVWSYHAFNVVVHVVAALILYGIIRRTLQSRLFGDAFQRSAHWIAFSAALIWAVHPLQTQSVTYIIQRGESLMGMFYLLTLYCVIRGAESPRRRTWYSFAIAACAVGMGCKAVMVTCPVLVFLYDVAFIARPQRETMRLRWALYLLLAMTWSVLAGLGIVRGVLDPGNTGATVGLGYKGTEPAHYALTQAGVVLHYLQLSVWPVHLCLDYGWPIARHARDVIVPAVLIGAFLLTTMWGFIRKSWLGFLGAWFFLILAPTSSVIPIKDAIFEHRMYLPLASVVLLLVVLARTALRILCATTSLGPRARRWIGSCVLAVIVSALGFLTINRNRVYHSAVAMWTDVVEKRPQNPRGHTNLCVALLDADKVEEAIDACERGVSLDPTFASGHYRFAKALKRAGRVDEAMASFTRAIELDPAYHEARFDLGNTFYDQGRWADAAEQYRSVTQLDPDNAGARINFGNALGHLAMYDEAIAEFRAAVRLRPEWLEARMHLATRLRALGRLEEAVEELSKVLEDKPDYHAARRELDAANAELRGRSQ